MEYEYVLVTKRIEVSSINKFLLFLDGKDISLHTIAHNIGGNVSHLSKVLRKERPLSESLRFKLNEYLGTDF